jgi:asparagine synthase (glutamine-hydrolysing)
MCGLNLYFGRDGAERVDWMNVQLAHRGIRSRTKSYFGGQFHLGHVRLPIMNRSPDWDHPLSYGHVDGAMVGEVFNYRQFDVDAETDLKIVLERWCGQMTGLGYLSLEPYDGFWSMVFVDQRAGEETVTVVTDSLGKKPMYVRVSPYVRRSQRCEALSSEITSLARLGRVTPDEVYMAGVLKWGYVHDGSTPYREIRALPPGTVTVFGPKGHLREQFRYHVIEPWRNPDLMVSLTRAVKNRLVSDYPVCVLLSGGLDSTIVFELVKRLSDDMTAFHVDNDEAKFLEHLDFTGVRLVSVKLEDVGPYEALSANQTPVDLGSVVPQYALGRAIQKEGFHVALSGDGADELFGGYRRAGEYVSQGSDVFHELIHYHLPRLDRLMMASTVELRCPFLSLPVVRHALSLPWMQRRSKEHLKDMFKNIVPEAILKRKKVPLKIEGIRGDNKLAWRRKMYDLFRGCVMEVNDR